MTRGGGLPRGGSGGAVGEGVTTAVPVEEAVATAMAATVGPPTAACDPGRPPPVCPTSEAPMSPTGATVITPSATHPDGPPPRAPTGVSGGAGDAPRTLAIPTLLGRSGGVPPGIDASCSQNRRLSHSSPVPSVVGWCGEMTTRFVSVRQ